MIMASELVIRLDWVKKAPNSSSIIRLHRL